MKLQAAQWSLAALLCCGCGETTPQESHSHAGKTLEVDQAKPLKKRGESKKEDSFATIAQEEGEVRLAALMNRLEQAAEQAAQAEDELPMVFGAVTDSVGNRYVGQFKNGKRHGYGTYHFVSGDSYEGEYAKGLRQGFGTYRFKGGDSYVGYFENGKYDRWGTYFFKNGDKYFGQYANGQRNGQGTLARADGERYEGEFKNGKRHGLGRCFFKNGEFYAGAWKNNEPDGWGSYHYKGKAPVSDRTKGVIQPKESAGEQDPNMPDETRNTLLAGHEFLTQAGQLEKNPDEESVDLGNDGKPSSLSQTSQVPIWQSDEPLMPVVQELPSGDRYVGQLRDGQPHGQGAYLFSGGERYVGDFQHGRQDGQGLLVLGDGRRFLGEWKDGLRNGYGVLYDLEGHVERAGYWERDLPVGN